MKTIGLAMIVRDAADVLAVCLESVRGLFDEMVIVDTGSLDNTKEIAQGFGATVIDFPWVDTYRPGGEFGFAAARNFSWSHLQTDWKMWLDADDILIGHEHFPEMLEKLERREEVDGVAFEYLYSFDTTGEQTLAQLEPAILDRRISFEQVVAALRPRCITTQFRERVVRNDPTWRWKYPVHEALSVVGKNLARYDKIKVVHRRHVRTHREWTDRNWKLLQQIPPQERDERVWFYLGLEGVRKDMDAAIEAFKQYLEMATVEDEKYFATHYVADIYRKKNELALSKQYDLAAVALKPAWRDAYAGLLSTSIALGDWKQAIYYGAQCANAEVPDTPFAYNPVVEAVGWIPEYVQVLHKFGMYDEALKFTEQALQQSPNDSALINNQDLLSAELNYEKGIANVAEVIDFLLRTDDAESAAWLLMRFHKHLQKNPQLATLLIKVNEACRSAAAGRVEEEPLLTDPRVTLLATQYRWADPRLRYLRELFSRDPRIQNVLQVGGPTDAKIAYEEIGIHADRVAWTANVQGRYDAVILFNALERIQVPESLIQRARECVRPDGALVGFVSNGPAHKSLAPPDQVPIRMRAYTPNLFRQAMGTVTLPTVLPGWSAHADQLALAVRQNHSEARSRTIGIYCPGAPEPWGPESLIRGIGGSEEAVIRLSRAFSARGHRVIVYGTGWTGIDQDTIPYRSIHEYRPCDILLGWRHPEIFVNQVRPLESGWRALWLHDSIAKERVAAAAPFVNAIWCISDYHAGLYEGIPGVYKGRNGVDRYMFVNNPLVERDPRKLVYVSTPFRGLDKLIAMFWPEIKKRIPDASLHAYYGWDAADRMGVTSTVEGQLFKQKITEAFAKDPALVWHGRIGQEALYHEMATAGVWAYPSTWKEEHCISAYMTQGSGVWPVVSPIGALPQSVVFGECVEDHAYVNAICEAVENDGDRSAMGEWIQRWCSWDDVATQWEHLWNGGVETML